MRNIPLEAIPPNVTMSAHAADRWRIGGEDVAVSGVSAIRSELTRALRDSFLSVDVFEYPEPPPNFEITRPVLRQQISPGEWLAGVGDWCYLIDGCDVDAATFLSRGGFEALGIDPPAEIASI